MKTKRPLRGLSFVLTAEDVAVIVRHVERHGTSLVTVAYDARTGAVSAVLLDHVKLKRS